MDKIEKTDLLMRKLLGLATPEEMKIAGELLKNDKESRDEWERLMALYEEDQVQQFLSSDVDQQLKAIVGNPAQRQKKWLAVAAILFVVTAGSLYFLVSKRQKPLPVPSGITLTLADGKQVDLPQTGQVKVDHTTIQAKSGSATFQPAEGSTSFITLKVPIGKTYQLQLPDGSTIHLNSASNIKFPFSFTGSRREIYLEGEAFINVKPQPNRPFWVHFRQGSICVLGTSFNVATYQNLQVSLQSGSLSVSTQGKEIRLRPGYKLRADSSNGTIQVKPFEEDEEFSWMKGIIYYEEAPLSEILTGVQRHYNVTIVVETPKLLARQFTVVIDTHKPISDFLFNLQQVLKNEIRQDSAHVIHLY